MTKKITKAIICAAGQGTRFLPMTKAMPKEMLPIIDKPIIQYVVEGAVAAGITDIIIVGSSTKQAIEDHFDHQPELEAALRAKGKDELADRTKAVSELANFVYLRQKGQYGNGTPVLNAAHLLSDDEPFMVLFADDFFCGKVPHPVQLVEAYERVHKPVISLIPVSPERAVNYGVADIKSVGEGGTFEVAGLIEKPTPDETPLHDGQVMASVSGYVLTPEFLSFLRSQEADKSGEIVLANAINRMAAEDGVYGQLIDGKFLDCGNREKYLEAIVEVALQDAEVGAGFEHFLRTRLG